MRGIITVYVDSEVVASFQGEHDYWMRKETFEIPRQPELQLVVRDTPEPELNTMKTITLYIDAVLAGKVTQGGEVKCYLCVFCYNYDNPTAKQMELDIQMARGYMRRTL